MTEIDHVTPRSSNQKRGTRILSDARAIPIDERFRKTRARASAKNVNILRTINRRDRGTFERERERERESLVHIEAPARLECHFNYSENDSRVPLHVRR